MFRRILKFGVLTTVAVAVVTGFSTNFVEGSGVKASEERTVGSITEVILCNSGDLVVIPSDTPSLIVTADENLLDLIETKIRGNTLTIQTKRGNVLRSKTPIKYTLMVKKLDKVSVAGSGNAAVEGWTGDALTARITGSGNMTLQGVSCNDLSVAITGSGDLSVSGTTKKLAVKVNGSGDVDATALQSTSADVSVNGSGDVSVWASESLKARVNGSGDVMYKGNPSIDRKVNGSGSITPLAE